MEDLAEIKKERRPRERERGAIECLEARSGTLAVGSPNPGGRGMTLDIDLRVADHRIKPIFQPELQNQPLPRRTCSFYPRYLVSFLIK
jgi:hypothetical protein